MAIQNWTRKVTQIADNDGANFKIYAYVTQIFVHKSVHIHIYIYMHLYEWVGVRGIHTMLTHTIKQSKSKNFILIYLRVRPNSKRHRIPDICNIVVYTHTHTCVCMCVRL